MIHTTEFERHFETRLEFTNLELTLNHIDSALAELAPLKGGVVHVAGTNGKGSTSLFIAHMLEQAGYTTLLFTSPHISSITERIQFGLKAIDIKDFDKLFHKALPAIIKFQLSYFETIFYMAMIAAVEKQPDYIILETGLGGRLDATNSAYIGRKTTVLTAMGQDHKHFLGASIYSIIAEKTAIARGGAVFVGSNKDFILQAIQNNLQGMDIRLPDLARQLEAEKYFSAPYSDNYLNALSVVEYLTGQIQPVAPAPLPPCRRERIGRVILDGAHNPSGLISLMKSLQSPAPCMAIVGITSDRDITKHLHIIENKIPKLILTSIPNNERSLDIDKLKQTNRLVISDPADALHMAESSCSGDILVTGSLYLCSYIREKLI